MKEQQIEIINKLGLHARAAAKLVNTAARFGAHITIKFGQHTADAKSIMSVMMLAASQGSLVTIRCDGEDEAEAMAALEDLINAYFEEEQ